MNKKEFLKIMIFCFIINFFLFDNVHNSFAEKNNSQEKPGKVKITNFFGSVVLKYLNQSLENENVYLKKERAVVKVNEKNYNLIRFDQSITVLRSAFIFFITRYQKQSLSFAPSCQSGKSFSPACFSFYMLGLEEEDIDKINFASVNLFNYKLIEKKIKINVPENRCKYFIYYNFQAIKEIFKILYIKPEQKIQSVRALDIYTALYKDFMRSRLMVVKKVQENDKIFKELVEKYRVQMQKDLFDARPFLQSYITRLKIQRHDDRFLGMLVRRKIDGSLDVILKIFDTIMKDYDSKWYQKNRIKVSF